MIPNLTSCKIIIFLKFQVQLLMYRSLSNYLLLPWPNISSDGQQWEKRSTSHHTFLRQLVSSYVLLHNMPELRHTKTLQEQGNIYSLPVHSLQLSKSGQHVFYNTFLFCGSTLTVARLGLKVKVVGQRSKPNSDKAFLSQY